MLAAAWAYLEVGELVFGRKLLWIRKPFWALCEDSLQTFALFLYDTH